MPGSTQISVAVQTPNDSPQVITLEPLVSCQFVTLASWKGVEFSLLFLSLALPFFTV